MRFAILTIILSDSTDVSDRFTFRLPALSDLKNLTCQTFQLAIAQANRIVATADGQLWRLKSVVFTGFNRTSGEKMPPRTIFVITPIVLNRNITDDAGITH